MSSAPREGISTPHKHDVLLGRGGASNHHHGNAVFRSVIQKTRPMYRSVPKHQKLIVARSVVLAVRGQDPPGRFLERKVLKKQSSTQKSKGGETKSTDTKGAKGAKGGKKGGGSKGGSRGGGGGDDQALWYEVSFERAVEKAKQALREKSKDELEEDDDDDSDSDEEGQSATTGASTGKGTALGGVALSRTSSAGSTSIPARIASSGIHPSTLPAPLAPNQPSLINTTFQPQLSAADEATATRYRNMLHFGVAPSVVRSKMEIMGVPDHIVRSVLMSGGGSLSGQQVQGGQHGHVGQQGQGQQVQQVERHVQFASGVGEGGGSGAAGGGISGAAAGGAGGASGAAGAAGVVTGYGIVPAKRRVSSVILSMFGFDVDDAANDAAAAAAVAAAADDGSEIDLPQEVLDVIEEITPSGDVHTGPALAAARRMSGELPQQTQTTTTNRRRSSVFNLFRRKSRSLAGGGLTYEQRSCTSITYDSESHRQLLVELERDGVDVDGDGDGDAGAGAAAAAAPVDRRAVLAAGRQRKRKASVLSSPGGKGRASLSLVRQRQQRQQIAYSQQPPNNQSRPKTIAEAAALVAAETELEELEPEDVDAQPKRFSFTPAIFGSLFGSLTAGTGSDNDNGFGSTVDAAGNPVEAPGTTTGSQSRAKTMAEAAAAAAAADAGTDSTDADGPPLPTSPGLFRQSTSAARRSLVATMNLFQSVTGKEDPLGVSNRSEGSYASGSGGADGDDTLEPRIKRRRRSTWLSGLRFSTMPAAVESATSAVAAAQAVQGMDLVNDDDDDDEDNDGDKKMSASDVERLKALGKVKADNGDEA